MASSGAPTRAVSPPTPGRAARGVPVRNRDRLGYLPGRMNRRARVTVEANWRARDALSPEQS
ncbi:MAG: hypothetical protein CBC48_05535 [bacterium TMED88]|nr:MAG: hypothetical protein CBC48_05535 [bacterium TMED88]